MQDTRCRTRKKYNDISGLITRSCILHLFFVLILFISLPFNAFTQTYFFEYIKKANYGLANEKIYSIFIDKNQKVWMGTEDGLSLFDGSKKVENISKINGIGEYGINVIFSDSRGLIWMGHRKGGISRYDGKKFESRNDQLLFSDKDITSICEDAEGNIWITSDGGGAVKITNPSVSLAKIEYEQYKGNRLGDQIFSCTLLKNKKLYFTTSSPLPSVKIYDPKKNTFTTFKTTFFQMSCLFEDKDENIWLGTYHGGLYVINKKDTSTKVYDIRDGLASNIISTIFQDKKGDIWVGHYEGTGGAVTRIRNGNIIEVLNKKNGLNDITVYSINEDNEGNMLFGTREEGLAILKDESFTLFINNEKLFPNTEIWSFIEDKDKKLWFGTNDGLVVYKKDIKTSEPVYKIILGEDYFKPKQIRFIKKDKNQNLWFGTADYGLFVYDIKTKKFDCPLFGLDDFKEITALDVDKDNTLWIGAKKINTYLYLYNPKTKYGATFSQGDGLISNDVNSIYIDKNNVKYIGSGRGLTVVTDTINKDCPKYDLGGATPNCMTGDENGNVWIGTLNRGVLCFKNGRIIRQFSLDEGLLSERINFVSYFNGALFVGTGLGMNRIDLKTNNIYKYTERNGLPGIETKRNAVYIDSEKTLWIGTISGAVRYSPQFERSTLSEPTPHITRFIVEQDTLEMKEKTRLRYNHNSVTFDYYSISLTNPDAVQYKVMLEGGNPKWQYTTNANPQYTSSYLQPGTYTFKVMARNYAGVWSSKPAEFTFRINPPFYGTWWFISICIIIGLTILFTYIKVREKSLVREKHILEEKVNQRTIEIVNINHQLELKNKDIVDSINYASRIQNALLPPDLPFDNAFVLFKPKDIVSGDFFWFWAQDNMEWFAAVDCTGHGVPGAFMSIIGHSSLNKIVQESEIYKPSDILNQLNKEIADTLHHYHQDNQIHDGMDIALASYNRDTHVLEFAGAFNPLWIIRKNTLIETRANRYAIGLAPEIEKDFLNNEIKVENGDTIYLFSDGYADQFGGPGNKKLKVGYFKEILLGIQNLSMPEQKQHLDEFIETWKNGSVQIDDILVIGRRFEI